MWWNAAGAPRDKSQTPKHSKAIANTPLAAGHIQRRLPAQQAPPSCRARGIAHSPSGPSTSAARRQQIIR